MVRRCDHSPQLGSQSIKESEIFKAATALPPEQRAEFSTEAWGEDPELALANPNLRCPWGVDNEHNISVGGNAKLTQRLDLSRLMNGRTAPVCAEFLVVFSTYRRNLLAGALRGSGCGWAALAPP